MMDISNFKISAFKVKTNKPKQVTSKVRTEIKITKLMNGTCIERNGKFYCQLSRFNIKNNLMNNASFNETKDLIEIPFTDDSYNVKGCTKLFSKNKDEKGRFICYVRSEAMANSNIDYNKIYLPFAHNWDVRGNVYFINNKYYFRFKQLLTIHGYKDNNVVPIKDNDDK